MKARKNSRATGHRLFIFLLFLVNVNVIAFRENTIDYVVAAVNGEAITRSVLENESLLYHLLWKSDLQVQEIEPNGVIVLSGGEDYGLVANSIVEILDQETRKQFAHARIKRVDPSRATAVVSGLPTQTVSIGHFVCKPIMDVIKGLVLVDRELVTPVIEVTPNNIIVLSGGKDRGFLPRDIVEILDQETRKQFAHARIKRVDPSRATAVVSGSSTQTVGIGDFVRRPLVEIESVLQDMQPILNDLIDRELMMQEADRLGIPLARWKAKVDVELKTALGNEKLLKTINEKLGLETEEIRGWLRTRLILSEFRDRRFGRVDNLRQQAAEYYRYRSNEFYDQKLSRGKSSEEVLEEIQNRLRNQIEVDLVEWLKQQRSSSYIRKL